MTAPLEKPPSASSFLLNSCAGLVFIVTMLLSFQFLGSGNVLQIAFIGVVVSSLFLIAGEILILKVHRRPHVGLLPKEDRQPDPERMTVKLIGYLVSVAVVVFADMWIPTHAGFDRFRDQPWAIHLTVIPFFVIGWIYVSKCDSWLKDPYDGLWHFGKFVMREKEAYDTDQVIAFARAVLLRAVFLPYMIAIMIGNTDDFLKFVSGLHINDLLAAYGQGAEGFAHALFKALLTAYALLACVDILFGTLGYVLNFRVLDSNIKATDSTVLGWVFCLLCYSPFWEMIVLTGIMDHLYNNPSWNSWFSAYPVFGLVWGSLAVIAICIESLSALTFGLRFSNLSYRGLITSGPYRYTKHPQYIAKIFNRFFVFVPLLSLAGGFGVLLNLLAFSLLCLIYFLRARTEERFLSQFEEYNVYAAWINEHGLFRGLIKYLPFLRYSVEKVRRGII